MENVILTHCFNPQIVKQPEYLGAMICVVVADMARNWVQIQMSLLLHYIPLRKSSTTCESIRPASWNKITIHSMYDQDVNNFCEINRFQRIYAVYQRFHSHRENEQNVFYENLESKGLSQ
jgi:hypothetical protein